MSTIDSLGRHTELIILGDFNFNWLDRASSNDKHLFSSINLTQLINETTRVSHNLSSLLDWILVTNPEIIIKSGVMSDCLSDHSAIFCVWKIKIPRLPPKYITIRQYKNINYDYFIHDLVSINWNRLELIPSVDDAWNFIYSKVTNVINKHAPLKTIRVKGSHLPWINSDLINLYK